LNGIGKPVSAKASGISSASYCNSRINLPASFHLEFWIILVKKLLKQKEHFFLNEKNNCKQKGIIHTKKHFLTT